MLRITNVTDKATAISILRAIQEEAGEINIARGGVEYAHAFAGEVHTARWEPHTGSIAVTSNAVGDLALKDRLPEIDESHEMLEGEEARIPEREQRKLRDKWQRRQEEKKERARRERELEKECKRHTREQQYS